MYILIFVLFFLSSLSSPTRPSVTIYPKGACTLTVRPTRQLSHMAAEIKLSLTDSVCSLSIYVHIGGSMMYSLLFFPPSFLSCPHLYVEVISTRGRDREPGLHLEAFAFLSFLSFPFSADRFDSRPIYLPFTEM